MANIIDGKAIAAALRSEIAAEVNELNKQGLNIPSSVLTADRLAEAICLSLSTI